MPVAKDDSSREIIISLASKYHFEEKHAYFVEKIALQLFDLVGYKYGLDGKERNLLSHACLLHDIGSFINSSKHHKHGKYIVEHDEILDDYNDRNRCLLSQIVYNHRKKIHKDLDNLAKNDRDVVLKLSAILRVADALDYTRDEYELRNLLLDEARIIIIVDGILLERLMPKFSEKKKLFEEIFSLKVDLQQ